MGRRNAQWNKKNFMNHRTSTHPALNKLHLLKYWLISQTINVFPVTPCKPTMWQMPVILNVNDFVVATDLQPSQTYTPGNFATPRGSTASEIKMNNEIWVTHRNQLTLWQVENTATTSIPLSLKTHTYKISRHVQNPTFERPIEQST